MTGLITRSNIVGTFCPYVPVEIIEAAGLRSRLLSGLESEQPDSDLPANLCPYIRRCSSYLKSDRAKDELAGIIVTDSCAPMLRLWDFLDTKEQLFPLQTFLRIPRLNNQAAVDLFIHELNNLTSVLASITGSPISQEKLLETIAKCNRTRSLQQGLYEQILTGLFPHLPLSLTILMGKLPEMGRDQLNDNLVELLADVGNTDITTRPAGPRLLVTGSHFIDHGLLKILTGYGAVVVALDSCTHQRMNTQVIKTTDVDPITALAAGYLNRPPCPRMRSGREQIARMEDMANKGQFDGIIYILMKSCTLHTYTVPLWRQGTNQTNTPMLVLEVENAEWSNSRTVTRLEAFLESFR